MTHETARAQNPGTVEPGAAGKLDTVLRVGRAPGPRRPRSLLRGTTYALAAALLFGAGAPTAKLLVGHLPRLTLTTLIYVGAGLGLTVLAPLRFRRDEAPLTRRDLPLLSALVVAGGLAPFLEIVGLERVTGAVGALGLGFELPLTAVLAVLLFGDRFSVPEVVGIGVVFAGGIPLALAAGGQGTADVAGLLAIAGACGFWALDNNLTQRLSGHDPVAVTRIKALVAAVVALAVLFTAGADVPHDAPVLASALLLGLLSYGLPDVLFTAALRHLGAARAGALSATAPFLGAAVSVPLLGALPSAEVWVGGAIMALGMVLILRGRRVPLERRQLHVGPP